LTINVTEIFDFCKKIAVHGKKGWFKKFCGIRANPIKRNIVKSLTWQNSASRYRRFSNAALKPALYSTINGTLLPKNSPLIPSDFTSQSSQA